MLIVNSNDYFILWCHGFLSCLQSVRETFPWMHMDLWRSTLPIAFLGGAHWRSISQTFSRTVACGSSMCLFHFSGHGHILVLLFFSLAWRYFLHVDRISKTKKQTSKHIYLYVFVGWEWYGIFWSTWLRLGRHLIRVCHLFIDFFCQDFLVSWWLV